MSFDATDIDIFVLTYNRADLLPATLRSLLAQSARGAAITVLDNASTDGTEAAVLEFRTAGVRYERAPANLGWAGNLARAQALAQRRWTLVFHDDDLLHPQYLEYALQAINSMPELGLLASAMSFDSAPDESNWPITPPRTLLCREAGDLAALLYEGFPIHFGSALYRSDVLRSLTWESAQYGKIADRPFLLAAAGRQATLVFVSPLVRYRVHANQDSGSAETGPFSPQLAALHRCYRRHTGENPLSVRGRCFLRHNYRAIRDEFSRLPSVDRARFASLSEYLDFVRQEGGCTRFSLVAGRLALALAAMQRTLCAYGRALARRMGA
ncbi:glycosyltransferase family 2 protein [Herbaspirillum sp. LeCh32-8]|uniref:glycosyltransferase family 2 protein n=1 Tax=Herbaspirillum sp. LeCh32-8 TaxID=2821356 RepID=UPI001AE4A86E|nr:glycosyltransferase family 2 protein [Herbaspirillum sp. LeCh32-8]MBP0598382.1 glycosyltransferase family 2 protein [Herbaspirillum sp. LeCh32-8]